MTAVGAMPDPPAVTAGLAAIRARDPGFDEAAFIAGAEQAFSVVQRSWTEVDPSRSRAVMADGLWLAQVDAIAQRRGSRPPPRRLAVGRAAIVAASTDAALDTVTVRLHGSVLGGLLGAQGLAGAAVAALAGAPPPPRDWTEDWVFIRRAGTLTRPGAGLVAQRCPNCGAPAQLDRNGVCPYCHVPVMSGDYDWVLSRIDEVHRPTVEDLQLLTLAQQIARPPAPEWAPPPASADGVDLAAIAGHDPAFNAYELLATVRQTVFGVDRARTEGRPELSRDLLSPQLWELQRSIIAGEVFAHRHHILAFLEITGAQIVAASSAGRSDRVVVELQLQGQQGDVAEGQPLVPDAAAARTWTERWTFGRMPGQPWLVSAVDPAWT